MLKYIPVSLIFLFVTLQSFCYAQSALCKKCDKAIIEIVEHHYDSLTNMQIEEFLCSFDKSCHWNENIYGRNGTYKALAFEMFVLILNNRLQDCVEIIKNNKKINFDYLLFLLKNDSGFDLPYDSIREKLEKKINRNKIENKILAALNKPGKRNKQTK